MRYFGASIVLTTAFVLSAIAAVMSITGMIALFPAHAIVVAIMMGALEMGKVVASGWLKVYWNDILVPRLHKAYLVVATVVLMLITSLGIFGYLSAGHNEQLAPMANVTIQSQALERQIAQKDGEVKRLEARVALLDRNVASFIDNNRAQSGLRANQVLKKEREQLQGQIDAGYATINDLNNRLIPFKQQTSEVQAKLGPIQNVADFFGWTDSAAAVRFIIGMIMLVFDPLAIVLMISGLITLNNVRKSEETIADERFKETFSDSKGILEDIDLPIDDEDHFAESLLSRSGVLAETDLDLEDEPELEGVPVENTYEIVRSLESRPEEIEDDIDELDNDASVFEEEPMEESEIPPEDHRERLIQLLQSEPNFLKEVEQVIEQIAFERVAEENEKIRGGLFTPEPIKTYGRDHGVDE